jgi:anhydro-N-acetylmuramic acid kinase
MSGTSLDGIDVAVVEIHGRRVETVAFRTTRYSQSVKSRILGAATPQDLSRLNFELGDLYAKAVAETCRRSRIPLRSLNLIGCHGQTVYHEGVNTLQVGEAAVIAERLGIPVVSDFRTRDIAAGGHGAPLVPFVDDLLLRHSRIARVALNIGGIANITVLDRKPVIAFDTGPGNMVIDQLAAISSAGRLSYDCGGAIAARGRLNRELLDQLLADPYYSAKPPKTAGREQYGREFVERMLKTGLPNEDLIATATTLTAATIAGAIQRHAPGTKEVIAAGGGVHNKTLMAQIAGFLPGARLATTAEFGIDPDAKEAVAFAILAYRTWRRQPGNLPTATGARRPVILGKITP